MKFAFFLKETGELHSRVYDGPLESLELNTPVGYLPLLIEGEQLVDPPTQRVVDGLLEDFVPEQPDKNHIWNEHTRRWVLNEEAVAKANRKASSQSIIDSTELQTLRALREYVLYPERAEAVKARLLEAEMKVEALRDDVKTIKEAP